MLIVDDNDFFIGQQADCLGRNRFEIHAARSGGEAIEKARSLRPDLVLLDRFMEDMSGLEVCRTLKGDAATSSIPVLMISSGERDGSGEEAALAGYDGIIFKPVRRDQLLTMVQEMLGLDARRWRRAETSLPCTMTVNGERTEGSIRSLSGGGAFVAVDLPLLCGDMCSLNFHLPSRKEPVEIRAALVVRKEEASGAENEGVGLHFLTVFPDSREAVEKYVESVLGPGD